MFPHPTSRKIARLQALSRKLLLMRLTPAWELQIAGAIQAHFDRLQKYHKKLLGLAEEVEGDNGDD